ncbi:MAG: zf-HC2 domain-containing protein [Acidobacteriia bacterium]|jgi:anti-sigma factor RsiW|nr:zf-HC2 domain-containing protein [Terriglobia bacterium]
MMGCKYTADSILAYLDGRASAAERRELEAHLHHCADCRARVEEFRRLWSVLDELPAIEPSPAFDARLRERIAAAPQPSPWSWLAPAPRVLAAFAAMLLVAVWLSWQSPAPAPETRSLEPGRSELEFTMIRDLQVLEDYDVLANFEALEALPVATEPDERRM